MLILAVDTSGRECSLAVLRDQELLATTSTNSAEPYSSRVFRDLAGLLAQLSVKLDQFDLFAVSAGPGSFTGLRVGLTAVKAWAEIQGKPIAAVSGLHAVAAQAQVTAKALLAPVIDARRGQIYGALYERGGNAGLVLKPGGATVALAAEEFIALATAHANGTAPVFVTPTPDIIRPALQASGLASSQIEVVSSVLAPAIGRIGYEKALRGDVVDAITLDADYVRRSDAEVNWKGF